MQILRLKCALALFMCFAGWNLYAGEPDSKRAAGIKVADAYINIPVPGSHTTAGFFTLTNTSESPLELVGVSTSSAKRTELHSHTHKDGMMQMRREDKVLVPAKSSVKFAPGSYHLMLFDLRAGMQTGDQLQLLFEFSDGTRLTANAKVKSLFDQPHHH